MSWWSLACGPAAPPAATIEEARPVPPPPAPAPAEPAPAPWDPLVDPRTVGQPWGTGRGLTQFRGNPTHTWYGEGPVPRRPVERWRFPQGEEPLCHESGAGVPRRVWCGTGWTGQPVVAPRPDGGFEVIVGSFAPAIHFLDLETGRRTRPDFPVPDLIKGSVTLDPDGYPLLYAPCVDGRLRVLALDRDPVEVLWTLDSRDHGRRFNNDIDSSPLVVDGFLWVGAENGLLYGVELQRGLDQHGRVFLEPEVRVTHQGWSDEVIKRLPDPFVETSPAMLAGRLFFGQSSGQVRGLDVRRAREGLAPLIFDFWAGDDIDASPVLDEEGFVYVAVELEKRLPRALEVGQLLKLDPRRPDAPVVWALAVDGREGVAKGDGGFWATPALAGGLIYAPTNSGRLLAVDREDGAIRAEVEIGGHAWGSPALVDGLLILPTRCPDGGAIGAYDTRDPDALTLAWEVGHFRGCIESTPAVMSGWVVVGSRDGYLYGYADAAPVDMVESAED